MILPPPRSTLFPYTTLFRSTGSGEWIRWHSLAADLLEVIKRQPNAAKETKEQPGATVISFLPTGGGVGNTTLADRKSTRLNSSHGYISYAVFCLKKKNKMR